MLTFEVPLVRVRRGKCVGFAERQEVSPLQPDKACYAARALALGHRIVRAVENGEVRDFSEAAWQMGVSQPRVSMLVALTFLAPDIQEMLFRQNDRECCPKFHHLLILARDPNWKVQRISLCNVSARPLNALP